jgi:hypothetical protein
MAIDCLNFIQKMQQKALHLALFSMPNGSISQTPNTISCDNLLFKAYRHLLFAL